MTPLDPGNWQNMMTQMTEHGSQVAKGPKHVHKTITCMAGWWF